MAAKSVFHFPISPAGLLAGHTGGIPAPTSPLPAVGRWRKPVGLFVDSGIARKSGCLYQTYLVAGGHPFNGKGWFFRPLEKREAYRLAAWGK